MEPKNADDMKPGPYCDNDLRHWWVPVTVPYLEARRLVRECAEIDEWQRLLYLGPVTVRLDSEHEAGCEDDCPSASTVRAWHFEVIERQVFMAGMVP